LEAKLWFGYVFSLFFCFPAFVKHLGGIPAQLLFLLPDHDGMNFKFSGKLYNARLVSDKDQRRGDLCGRRHNAKRLLLDEWSRPRYNIIIEYIKTAYRVYYSAPVIWVCKFIAESESWEI